MTHAFGPIRLIVNPRAGHGAVERNLPELRRLLDERGLDHDVVRTQAPGEGTALARAALAEGRRYLLAVGGDGTVHEVVNGMVDAEAPDGGPVLVAPDAVLGICPAGSGCDFVRTFGLDRPPATLARHFASDAVMPVDLGVVTLTGRDGAPATRVFANIAEVGYGAEVVRRAARLPRLLGRVRYLLAAYGAIAGVTRQEAEVALAHATMTVPVVNLVVASGQFFGGGMKVAPRALPDDGLFNVLTFTGDRSQVFLLTQRLFRGEHLPHPQITEHQSPTVAFSPPIPMPVEADGELLGTTPAMFSLLPRALRLKT